jgi:hypothetical protein
MISEERLEKALVYLAKTDQEAAEAKVHMLRMEYVVDLRRRKGFLVSDGNIEERKAATEVSAEVQEAIASYCDAVAAYEKVKAKRATEELIVEVFRTLEASRRQGRI